ncbi:hypothetical protein [Massilia horti]|uniref:Lipoprotein n=1 Tax=Massilia horti TaxID=2562153 RepID=A0A4Y9T0S5_9BURK|nr:hypothetical protein [Massilia horti]TFW32984.1 hypothetical protein E4O92_08660 [Massilia horti]
MKQILQPIFAGGALVLALSACSSTGTTADQTSGSSNTGATSSSTGEDEGSTPVKSGAIPPPVIDNSSTGNVIDDRVNSNRDIPGTNR